MKRILTVQDISCVGKCSLTVALPIISAMGIEAAVLPTAVLSTHTQFSRFTFRDLTEDISPILNHWKEEKIGFDALYTGYLGSQTQIDLMKQMLDDFGDGILKFVDPAMADNGKMYAGFDKSFALSMATLCAKADVIVPNLTESCYMLGMEYPESYDEEFLKKVLNGLLSLGAKSAVITGVTLEKDKLGVYGYDGEKGEFFSYFTDEVKARYHGTGDIYSSVCLGGLVNGKTLHDACAQAADFTALSIRKTLDDNKGNWYGVNFEQALGTLCEGRN